VEHLRLHSWNVDRAEAERIQQRLRAHVVVRPPDQPPRLIAGADAAYDETRTTAWGAIVVLDESLRIVESATASAPIRFPYVAGLLAFREAPPLLAAWQQLKTRPDVLILDGHGIAHPARFGLASHLGLWLNVPTIGCAKTCMTRDCPFPAQAAGSKTPILQNSELVGFVLRTRDRVKPVFVSPGHLMDPESAARIIRDCCRGYRLPEPLRQANRLANLLRNS